MSWRKVHTAVWEGRDERGDFVGIAFRRADGTWLVKDRASVEGGPFPTLKQARVWAEGRAPNLVTNQQRIAARLATLPPIKAH